MQDESRQLVSGIVDELRGYPAVFRTHYAFASVKLKYMGVRQTVPVAHPCNRDPDSKCLLPCNKDICTVHQTYLKGNRLTKNYFEKHNKQN